MVIFPGAEGFASDTVAGKGGRDLDVTNLYEDGDGSLRMALNQPYPRSIHFKVGGDIWHTTPLTVKNPYFTLEAISAPSPVTLRGEELRVETYEALLRHIRIRTGDTVPPKDGWDNRDACKVGNPKHIGEVKNIYFDHCDFNWSVDELLSQDYKANNATYSHCIFAEALNKSFHPEGAHSRGPLFRYGSYNISLIKSIIASSMERSPQVVGIPFFDMYNCLIYNYGNVGTELKSPGIQANFRNNVYKKGPDTTGAAINISDDAKDNAELFFEGNISNDYPDSTKDNWDMIKDFRGKPITQANRRTTPHATPTGTILPTNQVELYLLYNAGAKMPSRDFHTTRILLNILNNTGKIIDSPSQVGG